MHTENSIQNQAFLYSEAIKASGRKILTFWPARKGGNAHANIFRHCALEYLLGVKVSPPEPLRASCEYIRVDTMEKYQGMIENAGYTIQEFEAVIDE